MSVVFGGSSFCPLHLLTTPCMGYESPRHDRPTNINYNGALADLVSPIVSQCHRHHILHHTSPLMSHLMFILRVTQTLTIPPQFPFSHQPLPSYHIQSHSTRQWSSLNHDLNRPIRMEVGKGIRIGSWSHPPIAIQMETGTRLEIITYTHHYNILPNLKNKKLQHITILPFSLIANTVTQMGICTRTLLVRLP